MKNDFLGLGKGLTSYGDNEFSLFLRRAFIKGAGYSGDALNRRIVGVIDTRSGFNPCHGNVDRLIESVSRGVLLAGGLPIPFPTISIHEGFSYPTSMYLRNLMSMDTEEMIKAQPMDAVVLIGGCDKTVPAQLMGALSANVPAVQLVTGPMLAGSHRGVKTGACTDCRYYWGEFRGNRIDAEEIEEINGKLVPSVGTCSVMGTASTMACLSEALGMSVPGSASAPAVSAERFRAAEESGRVAVALAEQEMTPSNILTHYSFENAMRVLLAIGGSTNGIIHLTAIAGRMGIKLEAEAWDRMSRETPVLVNMKPSGKHYMEDFHHAGGLQAVMLELRDQLHLNALTVDGRTLGEILDTVRHPHRNDVIRKFDKPHYPFGSIAHLGGNLAPDGAIIKQSAANAELMEHVGKAVVFEGLADMAARIDSEDLDVDSNDVLVLKNIGPVGAPGMPEAGYIPIPRKLARQGITDMVRLSDGRMSGTAAGTIVLHIAPEAAVGGPLSLVRNGDQIRLSVQHRSLELLVEDSELLKRKNEHLLHDEKERPSRGYLKLFVDNVTQANRGCDFEFLEYVEPASQPAEPKL